MNKYLEEIITRIEPKLSSSGFKKKGEKEFVRDNSADFGRQEYIVLGYRAHSSNPDAIFVNCMTGIRYKKVRKIEAEVINDHLIKYPLVAGSISHFSKSANYFSIEVDRNSDIDAIVSTIYREIEDGSFQLFVTLSNLGKFLALIKSNHPFLRDYNIDKIYNERKAITIAIIIYCIDGKNEALTWLENNIKDKKSAQDLITKFARLKD